MRWWGRYLRMPEKTREKRSPSIVTEQMQCQRERKKNEKRGY